MVTLIPRKANLCQISLHVVTTILSSNDKNASCLVWDTLALRELSRLRSFIASAVFKPRISIS